MKIAAAPLGLLVLLAACSAHKSSRKVSPDDDAWSASETETGASVSSTAEAGHASAQAGSSRRSNGKKQSPGGAPMGSAGTPASGSDSAASLSGSSSTAAAQSPDAGPQGSGEPARHKLSRRRLQGAVRTPEADGPDDGDPASADGQAQSNDEIAASGAPTTASAAAATAPSMSAINRVEIAKLMENRLDIGAYRVQISPTADFEQPVFDKTYDMMKDINLFEEFRAEGVKLEREAYWVRIAFIDLLNMELPFTKPRLYGMDKKRRDAP